MKKVLFSMVSLIVAVVLAQIGSAGDLDGPDWGPQSGGGMYSLSDIYYYITEGTEFTATTFFTEPAQGPSVSTMMDLKTLGDDIKALFAQCSTYDQVAPNLDESYYFFCTDTNYWGVQQGTQSWYGKYGPSGTGDVVQIGSMYVASDKNGTGCAGNGTKPWAAACSWATGLNWLGESTGWRVPSVAQLITICSNKASLASYQAGEYWSTTQTYGYLSWYIRFNDCFQAYVDMAEGDCYVRAVRTDLP